MDHRTLLPSAQNWWGQSLVVLDGEGYGVLQEDKVQEALNKP